MNNRMTIVDPPENKLTEDQPQIGDPIQDGERQFIKDVSGKLGFLGEGDLSCYLSQRDGAWRLAALLPQEITHEEAATPTDRQRGWELLGSFYMQHQRYHDSIAIYASMYEHMLLHERETNNRVHKGMPLVWMGDCHARLAHNVHAKRYLMLTLCEDAIRDKGEINSQGGPYFRLVWHFGLSPELFARYSKQCFDFFRKHPRQAMFPERVLVELDQEWMVEVPSLMELNTFYCNHVYVSHLLSKLGSDMGKSLEYLGHYLLSLIPGCRAYLRKRSKSTDYDVVGLLEGPSLDFRSELGKYLVCECKDWDKPADFTTLAKFCRVLDSVKSRFGILFSRDGISGAGKSTDAEREQYKVFADRGIVIVVVTRSDLDRVATGANFLSLLRMKYEEIRLDLKSLSKRRAPKKRQNTQT